MPGLVPGIHVLLSRRFEDVDGRDKPGYDEEREAATAVSPTVWITALETACP